MQISVSYNVGQGTENLLLMYLLLFYRNKKSYHGVLTHDIEEPTTSRRLLKASENLLEKILDCISLYHNATARIHRGPEHNALGGFSPADTTITFYDATRLKDPLHIPYAFWEKFEVGLVNHRNGISLT